MKKNNQKVPRLYKPFPFWKRLQLFWRLTQHGSSFLKGVRTPLFLNKPDFPQGPPILHLMDYGQIDSPLALSILRSMILAGANVNLKGAAGNTSLHVATYRKAPDWIELLLKAGADPNLLNEKGETPLHFCGSSKSSPRQTKERDQQRCLLVANQLVRAGCPIHAPDLAGHTPLWRAIQADHPEMIQMLLTNGAELPDTFPDCSPKSRAVLEQYQLHNTSLSGYPSSLPRRL